MPRHSSVRGWREGWQAVPQRGYANRHISNEYPPTSRKQPTNIAANERTFMHWMNQSVTIGSIAAALLGESPCLVVKFVCARWAPGWLGQAAQLLLGQASRLGAALSGKLCQPLAFRARSSLRASRRAQHTPPTTHTRHSHHAGVSGSAHKKWGSAHVNHIFAVRVMAIVMMIVGITMAIYAASNFRKRGDMLL